MEPDATALETALIGLVVAASLYVWSRTVARWRTGQPLLPYEPRRDVPWGTIGLWPAVMVVALTGWSAWQGDPDEAGLQEQADRFVENALASAAIELSLIAILGVALVVVHRASASDLGVPTSAPLWRRDLRLGSIACLAAMMPVYAIQMLLMIAQGPELAEPHPLIRVLQLRGDELALLAAALQAVVVAPVFEEFIFRLLLQGWLEKVERRWRWARYGDIAVTGRWAIAGSSALFALAHVGHGFDPIPLFVLALILGYVYRQTHRVAPCVVLHMLFNGFTLLVLWMTLEPVPGP
jgi:membrane protease YdiL (CAAX protease family)